MADPIRVFLVDDHAVVRQGLRAFLELQDDIEVVGEASGGVETLREAPGTLPDVVLMDLVMPEGDGITAIRQLRAALPKARVLVLTSFSEDPHVYAALDAGAAGYLLKDVDPATLAGAIRDVRQGRPALHPEIASRLMRVSAPPRPRDFTPRELDVLRLVVEGLANKQAARRLGITEKTVKTHVSNILQKLGAADRTQAAVLAVRNRLVEEER
jgi:NarL family two-component system response regulator LiaR